MAKQGMKRPEVTHTQPRTTFLPSPSSRAGQSDQREGKTHYRMTNRYKRQSYPHSTCGMGITFIFKSFVTIEAYICNSLLVT